MDSKLRLALMEGDLRFIVGYLAGRLGLDISMCWAKELHEAAVKQQLPPTWSDCSTLMWLKNRLTFPLGFGAGMGELPPCEMHVFFLMLEETPAMWDTLKADEVEIKPKTARSKISTTQLAEINPINTTARAVVPPDRD